MYSSKDDPWGFDERWYEQRKYAVAMAALPRERYERAFEPGCANGALTELLAARCESVVAAELLPDVAERARTRLSGHEGVSVEVGEFPGTWPDGTGDLVVWSEIAYYLTEPGCETALERLASWLRAGGDLVAVHWLGETNYPRPGSAIADWLDAVPTLDRLVSHVDEEFELGVWRHSPTPGGRA